MRTHLRRSVRVGLASVSVVVAVVAVAAQSATAAPAPALAHKPSVGFHFGHGKVSQKGKMAVISTSHHVPRSAKIELQRPFGTGDVYRTVAKLAAGSQVRTALASPPMGRYPYRIVVAQGHKKLFTSKPHVLLSYGTVALATILKTTTHTQQIGNQLYRYAWSYWLDANQHKRVLHRDATSCRSISLTGAVHDDDRDDPKSGSIQVIQEDADPQSGKIQVGQVDGPYTFSLTGHAFDLNVATGGGESGWSAKVLINGSASCWSTNAQVSR